MCKSCGNCSITHTKSMDDYMDEAEENPWLNSQIKNG